MTTDDRADARRVRASTRTPIAAGESKSTRFDFRDLIGPGGEMQLFVRDPSGNLIELSCDADQPVDPAFFEHDVVEPEPQYYRRTR